MTKDMLVISRITFHGQGILRSRLDSKTDSVKASTHDSMAADAWQRSWPWVEAGADAEQKPSNGPKDITLESYAKV